MRITQEADYALRIVMMLAAKNDIIDAKTIAETTDVSQRFTFKILHKLVQGGIVQSFKGVNGGYKLSREPSEISMLNIIESIDGPITLVKCVDTEHECSQHQIKGDCLLHHVFGNLNELVAKKLASIPMSIVSFNDREVYEILKLLRS